MDHYFKRQCAPLTEREARAVSKFLREKDETLCELGPGRCLSDAVIDMLLLDTNSYIDSSNGSNLVCPSSFYAILMFGNTFRFKKLKGRGVVCEAKRLFFPLLLECERTWVLVMIDTLDHTVQIFNSCRAAMSPLTNPERECLENVYRWYQEELQSVPILVEEDHEWLLQRGSSVKYSVKTNDFDCGMYTVAFAAILSSGCSSVLWPTLTQEDIDSLRQRCLLDKIISMSAL